MHKQLLVAIITLFISIPTSLSAQSTKAYRPSPKGPSLSLQTVVGPLTDRSHFYFLDSDKESFLGGLPDTLVWLREIDEPAIELFKDSKVPQFPSGSGPVIFDSALKAATIIRNYYGNLWRGYPLFAWYYATQQTAVTSLSSQRLLIEPTGPHFKVVFFVSYDEPTYKQVVADGSETAISYVPFFDPNLDDEKCIDEDTAPCWAEDSQGTMKACCESQVVRYYVDIKPVQTTPPTAPSPDINAFAASKTNLPGFLKVALKKDEKDNHGLAMPIDSGRAFYLNYENYQPGVNMFIPTTKLPVNEWQIIVTMQGIKREVTAANYILSNATLEYIKATHASLLLTSGRQEWRGSNPPGLLLLLQYEDN